MSHSFSADLAGPDAPCGTRRSPRCRTSTRRSGLSWRLLAVPLSTVSETLAELLDGLGSLGQLDHSFGDHLMRFET